MRLPYMRLPNLIAVCGAKRSGKDVIADHLAEYGYENWKIAAPLKRAAMDLFSFTHDQVEGAAKDEIDATFNVTPRAIMQYLGTDVMQFGIQSCVPGIGRTFWIDKLFRDVRDVSISRKIAISDVRFPHEVAVIADKSPDYLLIKVIRPSLLNTASSTHLSEVEQEDIVPHIVLHNDGTLRDLVDKLDAALLMYASHHASIQ